MTYLDFVNFFSVDSVMEHPWRILLIWAMWYFGMIFRYATLSYEYYQKFHKPFLGQTVVYENTKHHYSNEQIREEIVLSLKSNVAIATLYTLASPFIASGYCPMYLQLDKFSYAYLPLSFLILALVHDAAQYWTHRMAHEWKWYFIKVHSVYHRFQHPTPFSSWSMHPVDAILMSIVVIGMVFILPLHPLVFLAYVHFASYFNAIGHVYVTEEAKNWMPGRLKNIFGYGMLHILHHKLVHINYFCILQFWDIKFSTSSRFKKQKSQLNLDETSSKKAS